MLAGDDSLDRPVRWVHSAEVPDIATLLRGGELVLTTGIGLPPDDAGLRAFIATLVDVRVAGLIVELGRRFVDTLPRVMIAAAVKHGLPLIELRKPTAFVRITESVHALIVDAQLAELRATEEIHQRFTELSVEGADAADVVAQAAVLAGAPIVLENLSRQVLAYDSAGDRAELLLDGWEAHSRRIRASGRTGYDADAGWLVTMVGARGQDWGRLLMRWQPGESAVDAPPTRFAILLEVPVLDVAPRDRPIRATPRGWSGRSTGTPLTALLDHTSPVDEVALRARALGVPLDRRYLVGVVVRYRLAESAENGDGEPAPIVGTVSEPAQARLRDLAEAVSEALREADVSGLAIRWTITRLGALIALRRPDDEAVALQAFVTALRRPHPGHGVADALRTSGLIRGGRLRRRLAPAGSALAGRGAPDRVRRPARPAGRGSLPAPARRPGRPAAPAPGRASPADVRGARTRPAARLRREAPEGADAAYAAVLSGQRPQQIGRRDRRAPIPTGLLRAARAHRPDPRRRSRRGGAVPVPARCDARARRDQG